MKILLVNDYATLTGGAELIQAMLRDGLNRRGHEARIFASNARPLDFEPHADYYCLGTVSRWRILLQSANPWARLALRRVLSEFRPDVVHVTIFLSQLSPLILAALKNVPCLYNALWYRMVCPKGFKIMPDKTPCLTSYGRACLDAGCLPLRDWLPLMLQMFMARRGKAVFDRVVTATAHLKHELELEGISPVEIVPNGVPVRPARPPLDGAPLVVFAGRLVEEKGPDILLRAFAAVRADIPEARLLMAGDGPARAHCETLIRELHLADSVRMTGFISRDEAERLFGEAWVQVVPSRWPDVLPLASLEAMMRGTAIIAANIGGLGELIEEGKTGHLVPPNDTGALAGRVRDLLLHRERAERMGAAGRLKALAHFSEDIYVERFLGIYTDMLSASQSRNRTSIHT